MLFCAAAMVPRVLVWFLAALPRCTLIMLLQRDVVVKGTEAKQAMLLLKSVAQSVKASVIM